jgi:hypothetical protein
VFYYCCTLLKADGVRAGTDYICYVQMTVVAYNGTVEVGVPLGTVMTRTTPRSEEESVTTVEGKGKFCFESFNTALRVFDLIVLICFQHRRRIRQ